MSDTRWIKNDDGQIIGFDCPYHGSKVLYTGQAAFANTDDLVCPSCGNVICPECASMGEAKPVTKSDAEVYLDAAQQGVAKACCGHCNDYGYSYMIKYLRLVGCELPDNLQKYQQIPQSVDVVVTERVALLMDEPRVRATAVTKFIDSARGIITIPHPMGEIWAIPEPHPEITGGWLLTVCYPEER